MRFINADNYELIAELAQSYELNLYAYCGNNPVMFTDETGEGLFLLLALIGIGAVAGGTIGGVVSAKNGASFWGIVGGVIAGGLIGAAGGALAYSGGAVVFFGAKAMMQTTFALSIASIRPIALGFAIFDSIGAIVGPILGLNWQLIEWGSGAPEVPNVTPPYKETTPLNSSAVVNLQTSKLAKLYVC